MTNSDLRPPSDWESIEGIRIANRGVYRVDGRDEFTPIDYETYRGITIGLTVSRVPKSDEIQPHDIPATLTAPKPKAPAGFLSKALIAERIDTLEEEYYEAFDRANLDAYDGGFLDAIKVIRDRLEL